MFIIGLTPQQSNIHQAGSVVPIACTLLKKFLVLGDNFIFRRNSHRHGNSPWLFICFAGLDQIFKNNVVFVIKHNVILYTRDELT